MARIPNVERANGTQANAQAPSVDVMAIAQMVAQMLAQQGAPAPQPQANGLNYVPNTHAQANTHAQPQAQVQTQEKAPTPARPIERIMLGPNDGYDAEGRPVVNGITRDADGYTRFKFKRVFGKLAIQMTDNGGFYLMPLGGSGINVAYASMLPLLEALADANVRAEIAAYVASLEREALARRATPVRKQPTTQSAR